MFLPFILLFLGQVIIPIPIPTVSAYPNCTIKWSDPLPSWYPLVFNTSGVIYPRRTGNNGDWSIVIKRSSNIKLGCSADASNTVRGYGDTNQVVLKCKTAGLRIGTQPVSFSELGCTRQVKEQIVEVGSCYNDATAVDIMFQSKSSQFPLINICHDTRVDGTIFTHHYITGAGLNPYEVSNNRPSFKEAQFYTKISASRAYSRHSQLNQVAFLVGSQRLAEKYINLSRSSTYYFARGHLAPDGDFVHIYEQNATYYFINVSPQWQVINQGNWLALENSLRKYAKKTNADLEVWTGAKDILKLPDVNDNLVEIYLSRDTSGNLRVPVPEIFWKVVTDPARKVTVAVFIVNNPHLTEIPERLKLCNDICSQIAWVKWDTKNIQKGYTYCCDLQSTESILPYIPSNLRTLDLMT